MQTITRGISNPYDLAFDDSDQLYVANWSSYTVTVYESGRVYPTGAIYKRRRTAYGLGHWPLGSPLALRITPRGARGFVIANQASAKTLHRSPWQGSLYMASVFDASPVFASGGAKFALT